MKIPYIIMLSLMALVSSAAFAVPAAPGAILTTQPDGTPVEIYLHGDEYFSWASSFDGMTLLRDTSGYWTVAKAEDGVAVPSATRFSGRSARTLAPHTPAGLPVDHRARVNRPYSRTQIDNSFPTTGNRKLLMLLVNFSDTRTTYTQKNFADMMNAEGYGSIGSFRDYYLEQSYGKLDVETVVTRWINLPYEKSHYTIDNVAEIIRYALNDIADEISLGQFDNDGDGTIDGLAIIHQGAGQEASGNALDIWSHSAVVNGIEIDGVKVGRYTIEPEIYARDGRISTIGVICHEFGHNLGAPDFYDTDYSGSGGEFPGTGVWDLLGSGAWNGNAGDRPAGINMWQKIAYGWVTPTQLTDPCAVNNVRSSTAYADAYRFESGTPGEYFIIENRRRDGNFNSALPSEGLLIYHANDLLISKRLDANTLNATMPQAMYTVCAAANADPTSALTYGPMEQAPFTGQNGLDAFNDNTLPSTKSISGRYAYRGLRGIAFDDNGVASFDFFVDNAPISPANLKATADKGSVILKWEMADDAGQTHFNIYRDGILITQVTDCAFTDPAPTASLMTYQVDAEYADGLISPFIEVQVRVPVNKVSNLGAVTDDSSVTLIWSFPSKLTRNTTTDLNDSYLRPVLCDKVEYAHRFTADDLRTYDGSRIRKIAFIPYDNRNDAEYTIRVYKVASQGGAPEIISERKVKEFGVGIWNSVLLTSAVTIEAEQELWIGVEVVAKNKNITIVSETSDLLNGYGNLLRINGGEWCADDVAEGNFFIYAELSQAAATEMIPVGEVTEGFDPVTDLIFPIGFNVYRDGLLIGSVGGRCFVDKSPLDGEHTYSVATLYKGNNESSPEEIAVEGTYSGIAFIEADKISVRAVATGIIAVDGYDGSVTLFNLSGGIAYSSPAYRSGSAIVVPPGFYILRTAAGTRRILVM